MSEQTLVDELAAALRKAKDEYDSNAHVLENFQEWDGVFWKSVTALLAKYEASEQAVQLDRSKRPSAKLIGWRKADYTAETSDQDLAKNWATHEEVLPIFKDDVNTSLTPTTAEWREKVLAAADEYAEAIVSWTSEGFEQAVVAKRAALVKLLGEVE